MIRVVLALAALVAAGIAHAQPLVIELNVDSARAVLAAVTDPTLTRERGLAIARMPGNHGLIEKALSYGRPADDARLAEALLAAAQHRASEADADYAFAQVRDNAATIGKLLDALTEPKAHVLDDVRARVARFTPPGVHGHVVGYLVVGGSSGGFAFDKPEFWLNLARFPSPLLAKTVLAHELYHAVQQLGSAKPTPAVEACRARAPGGARLTMLYDSLVEEGTASFVGDVSNLADDADPAALTDRARARRGIGMVGRSVTLLQLSTHGLATDAGIDYDAVYGLGFYGDEILYSLGYVMSRAIVAEGGDAALAALIDKPGAAFIVRYAALKGYGKSREMPALDAETVRAARALATCG